MKFATLFIIYMKLYSHRSAANNRHNRAQRKKIYPKKYDCNDMTTIPVMTVTLKKLILTLAANISVLIWRSNITKESSLIVKLLLILLLLLLIQYSVSDYQ